MCFNTIYKIPSCFKHLYVSTVYQALLSGRYSEVKNSSCPPGLRTQKGLQTSKQTSIFILVHALDDSDRDKQKMSKLG